MLHLFRRLIGEWCMVGRPVVHGSMRGKVGHCQTASHSAGMSAHSTGLFIHVLRPDQLPHMQPQPLLYIHISILYVCLIATPSCGLTNTAHSSRGRVRSQQSPPSHCALCSTLIDTCSTCHWLYSSLSLHHLQISLSLSL